MSEHHDIPELTDAEKIRVRARKACNLHCRICRR